MGKLYKLIEYLKNFKMTTKLVQNYQTYLKHRYHYEPYVENRFIYRLIKNTEHFKREKNGWHNFVGPHTFAAETYFIGGYILTGIILYHIMYSSESLYYINPRNQPEGYGITETHENSENYLYMDANKDNWRKKFNEQE